MRDPRTPGALAVLAAILTLTPPVSAGGNCAGTSVGLTPLTELGAGEYRGEQGGLYPGGGSSRPAAHETAGRTLADAIQPLNAAGDPDVNGRYVLLSLGMSNTTQEFSAFKPIADADLDKDPRLVIVDGAQGGVTAADWQNPNHSAWSTVNQRLTQAGVTPNQVAVAWVKMANRQPTSGWPAYAEELRGQLTTIAGHLKTKFPNIRLAYQSSRIYAGYASTTLNPEPYAYEGGFSVKWLIRDQLNGDVALNHDPSRGPVTAPWLSWGPYLWADGVKPRSDGLTWLCEDFSNDGTHPSNAGRQKVAVQLLEFFKTDATAFRWFTDLPAPTARNLAEVTAAPLAGAVEVTGRLATTDAVLGTATDSATDGVLPPQAGMELTGASVTYRPSAGDLHLRLGLSALPPARGAPVVHGMRLAVAGQIYEVRAAFDHPTSRFALYRCVTTCTQVTTLTGSYVASGSTFEGSAEVQVSVPVSSVGAAPGAQLSGLTAFGAVGGADAGTIARIDELTLPDAAVAGWSVRVGVAPSAATADDVSFETTATLSPEGAFSGRLDTAGMPPGEYLGWARACLQTLCETRASAPVQLG